MFKKNTEQNLRIHFPAGIENWQNCFKKERKKKKTIWQYLTRVMKSYRAPDSAIFFCYGLENNLKYSKRFMYKDIHSSFIYIKK